MNRIYKRVLDAMYLLGVSKHNATNAMGLKQGAFAAWIKGKANPSVSALAGFASSYNVSLEWLVRGVPTLKTDYRCALIEYAMNQDTPRSHFEKVYAFIRGMNNAAVTKD